MSKPLEGLRVVEMGTHVAVPKAARMMADWGAEVIKVEPPRGEVWRTIGRVWSLPHSADNNVVFQNENANKKAISLNLKTQEGKDALLKLISTADVFLTNTRPVPLEGLGLDYESLKEKFPKLIYAHFSGFGDKGPDKDRAGFDVAAFWARCGVLVEWSPAESIPSKPTPGFGDGAVASALLAGILAALIKRDRTGEGEKISASLYGSALWYNGIGVINGQEKFGHVYPKQRKRPVSPLSPLYKTKDGDWLLIAEQDWDGKHPDLFKLVHMDAYIGDERFKTIEDARKHMPEIVTLFDEHFGQMDTKTLMEGLSALDIVHEKLANPRDICKDPQAWENGFLYEQTMEDGSTVVLPTNPIHFESYGEVPFNLAPHLGEHTVDILKDIGYSDADIELLLKNKAAVQKP